MATLKIYLLPEEHPTYDTKLVLQKKEIISIEKGNKIE